MPKRLGTKCVPKKWIIDQIKNGDVNRRCTKKGRYLILDIKTAAKYWNLYENFNDTLGSQSNPHYLTIGTDGDVCIKAFFMKNSGISNITSDNSNSTTDWRQCSVWVTDYCLKIVLPSNSTAHEIVLVVENCYVIQSSECVPHDYEQGFMRYCMEDKEVLRKIYSLIQSFVDEKKESDVVVCEEEEEENHNLSLLIALLDKFMSSSESCEDKSLPKTETRTNANGQLKHNVAEDDKDSVNEVNICEECDDAAPPLKKFKRAEPPLISVLWRNAAKDFPDGWTPDFSSRNSSPTTSSSPIVIKNSVVRSNLPNDDEILIDEYPSTSVGQQSTEPPPDLKKERVFSRQKIQTDRIVTDLTGDDEHDDVEKKKIYFHRKRSRKNNIDTRNLPPSNSSSVPLIPSSRTLTHPPSSSTLAQMVEERCFFHDFYLSDEFREKCVKILFD